MRLIRIFLILSLFFGAICLVIAQDGGRDGEPNWCYEGNAWGDGRCNNSDPAVNAYNWDMGWLLAQCQLGTVPIEACIAPDANGTNSQIVGSDQFSFPAGSALVSLNGGINTNGSVINWGACHTTGGSGIIICGTPIP